ncbi:PepSY domain-containing protein [Nitrincola sp.]|uniref:PepSY domain-containing protein n=1 Tax=Nitrincola sp. TaxID=1926584 RepID=UPI003A90CB8D
MCRGRSFLTLRPLLALLLSGLLLSSPLVAEPVTSLKRASEIAQDAFGGQVVKAEEAEVDHKPVFLIRIVNDGRVRDVMVNPDDGEILNP